MPPRLARTLLCIDDRSHMLRLRETLLTKFGFVVISATNAAVALRKLENCAVDAVLLEYTPEGLDAEAIAFQIKQKFPLEPIVLLSAVCEMPQRILWLVDEYVMKSESIDGLVKAIERVLAAPAEVRKPCVGRVIAFNGQSTRGPDVKRA